MSLDKWIPGYKPRENKEVSHDRRSYIPHSTTKEKYSNEYIKQRIENDPWIYDPRCQKIWYQSKFNNAYENDEWHTNSGHSNYIAPFWKKNRGSKEELYHIILANKNKHLRTLLKYFESDLKQHIRTMRDFAKSRDMKYTEIWKEHSLEAWKNVNMVREELNLSQIPMPDIFKLSVREIVIKVLEEQKLKKKSLETYPTKTKEINEYRCEICGKATTDIHQLRTGEYQEYFPDKRVCWDCYVRENKKFYEKYSRCPDSHTRIKLDEWPNFKCENGCITNVNFIDIDAERLLDDVYGKIPPEDYKKLHDTLLRLR